MRFQPIRRPQTNQKKAPKPGFPKAIPPAPSNAPANKDTTTTTTTPSGADAADTPPSTTAPAPAAVPPRSTLADWAGGDDDEYWGAGAGAVGEKRQRGGRKAAKKRRKQLERQQQHGQQTDWDEIYDPSRPTNVDEYLRSDERVREVQEWKAVLYAHRRMRRKGSADSYGESEEESEADLERPGVGSKLCILLWLRTHGLTCCAATSLTMIILLPIQISSPLRRPTPSHHRPCHRPRRRHGTRPLQRPCPTTRPATTPTPDASLSPAWPCQHPHRPRTPRHRPRLRLHHLLLPKTARPYPARRSDTKHHLNNPLPPTPWTLTLPPTTTT